MDRLGRIGPEAESVAPGAAQSGRMPTHFEASVAVVVPAYRVAAHIEGVLRSIPRWVRWIVVVDDASPDSSAEIVARVAAEDRRVSLVRHTVNQGVGGAVCSGYKRALELGADIIAKMDGDGQMDARYLRRLIAPIVRGDTDYTKGNRFHHTEELKRMPAVRLIGNAALGFLVRLASGYWNLYDPTNGYTAINSKVLRQLRLEEIARDYFFESHMLSQLGLLGACVMDVPIPARYANEESSMRIGRVLYRFPPLLVRSFLRRLWTRHLMASFSVFGLYVTAGTLLLLLGTSFGLWHWARSLSTGLPATAGTVMLGALPVLVGFILWIQAIAVDVASVPRLPLSRQPEPDNDEDLPERDESR
jgi:dolichol-phosphate mannosyltransferase